MITSHSGVDGEGTPSDAEQTVSLFLELILPQKPAKSKGAASSPGRTQSTSSTLINSILDFGGGGWG